MAIVVQQEHARLRLSPGVTGLDSRVSAGVLMWLDVPLNSPVTAYVDRPSELLESDKGGLGGQGAVTPSLAPYKFERGPVPAAFVAGDTLWRTRNRILVSNGAGALIPYQMVPTWVAFAAPQTGSLAEKGRKTHQFSMPGGATKPADRNILRMRWTGTVAAGEVEDARLVDPVTGAAAPVDGVRKKYKGTLLHASVVPGSVILHATVGGGALVVQDTGDGRLVGLLLDSAGNVLAQADGIIDYLSGVFTINFGTPTSGPPDAATSITVDYEYGCQYLPLDAIVEWDSLLQ